MKRRQQNRVTNRKSNLLNRIDILRNKEKPAIDKIRLNGGFLSNSSTAYEDKKEKTNRQNNDLSLRVLEAGLTILKFRTFNKTTTLLIIN